MSRRKAKLHRWRLYAFVDRYHFGIGLILERTEMGWQLTLHLLWYIVKLVHYITANRTARSLAAAAYHYNRIVDLVGEKGIKQVMKWKRKK